MFGILDSLHIVSHVEHQIGAQLWKHRIVGKQSVYYTAVMSKVYLCSKDCVDVGHMRACS